ncbi:hypothetical protein VNO78_09988 [Psophocarpus tetragonolobus]|uniref:Uncharacterized protein n=1 Tax=Psophocarpus tetragonolobus TaxID=3891 RepID=A0AAN9XMB3_PSOTE
MSTMRKTIEGDVLAGMEVGHIDANEEYYYVIAGEIEELIEDKDAIESQNRIGESSFIEFDVQFDSLDESEKNDGSLNMYYEVGCEDFGEHNFAKEGNG